MPLPFEPMKAPVPTTLRLAGSKTHQDGFRLLYAIKRADDWALSPDQTADVRDVVMEVI